MIDLNREIYYFLKRSWIFHVRGEVFPVPGTTTQIRLTRGKKPCYTAVDIISLAQGGFLSTAKDTRINEMIRAQSVRVIDDNGEQLGVLQTSEAIRMAQEKGLDLVEVSPGADPPVCKILDFGKYRFELGKKQRESKKKQKLVKLKEMRMQPKIDGHDLSFKVKHIREFLGEGWKVKVTVRFRGREMAHKELGKDVLDRVLQMLEDSYVLEAPPRMEGRFMSLMIAPGTKAKKG